MSRWGGIGRAAMLECTGCPSLQAARVKPSLRSALAP